MQILMFLCIGEIHKNIMHKHLVFLCLRMVVSLCYCLLSVNVAAPLSHCFGLHYVCPAVRSVNIMLCSVGSAHRWLNVTVLFTQHSSSLESDGLH